MIPEQFRRVAAQYRNEPAIVDGGERVKYGELAARIDRIANWLEQAAGLRTGDVVAASLDNTWQFAACFFAVCELGGVLMPFDPRRPAAELSWFAARLRFRAVICDPVSRVEWERVGDTLPCPCILTADDITGALRAGAPHATRAAQRSDIDPALYLATSGSTGAPKVVPRSHANLLAGARNTGRALAVGPGRRFLSVAPFHHANGFHNCVCLPLMSGAAVVMMRHFTAAACAELIHREHADVLIGSPFLYGALADRVADPGLMSTLQICVCNSARLPAALAQLWRERFGVRLRQTYGCAETSMISADCSPGEPPPTSSGQFVGTPIPEVEVKCLGPDNEALGPGEAGEIAVRSPAVMPGYLGDPEATSRAFHDGFFRTGDMGSLDSWGNLYLNGRIGRVINLAGVKADPVEIERAVEAMEGVSACYVDSVPDGREGQMIRARIAVRPNARVTRRDVISHCRRQLAEYKLPRIIEFVEALPATMAGKMPRE